MLAVTATAATPVTIAVMRSVFGITVRTQIIEPDYVTKNFVQCVCVAFPQLNPVSGPRRRPKAGSSPVQVWLGGLYTTFPAFPRASSNSCEEKRRVVFVARRAPVAETAMTAAFADASSGTSKIAVPSNSPE
jgi:hypothetical protein